MEGGGGVDLKSLIRTGHFGNTGLSYRFEIFISKILNDFMQNVYLRNVE